MAQMGGSKVGRQFLLTEILKRPEAKSPCEASPGLSRPLGAFL